MSLKRRCEKQCHTIVAREGEVNMIVKHLLPRANSRCPPNLFFGIDERRVIPCRDFPDNSVNLRVRSEPQRIQIASELKVPFGAGDLPEPKFSLSAREGKFRMICIDFCGTPIGGERFRIVTLGLC